MTFGPCRSNQIFEVDVAGVGKEGEKKLKGNLPTSAEWKAYSQNSVRDNPSSR